MMMNASECFFIGHDGRRFSDKRGLVHVSRILYQSVPRTQLRSRFVGVTAWCGTEHKRDRKLDKIVETDASPTCVRCIANESTGLAR
jgi:hypothetical protein